MTLKEVRKKLSEARKLAERRGAYEDTEAVKHEIFAGVLRTIAAGKARNPASLAAEAAKASDIRGYIY